MKIETKYNIGDKVYFIYKGKIRQGYIESYSIHVDHHSEYDCEEKTFTVPDDDSLLLEISYHLLIPLNQYVDTTYEAEENMFLSIEDLRDHYLNLSFCEEYDEEE